MVTRGRHSNLLLRIAALLLFLFSLSCQAENSEHENDSSDDRNSGRNESPKRTPSRGRIINLAESIKATMKSLEDPEEILRARRQYWRKTLQDIEKLSLSVGIRKNDPFLRQWKNSLDEEEYESRRKEAAEIPDGGILVAENDESEEELSISSNQTSSSSQSRRIYTKSKPRFEGFPSWERMLQEWADDIQEYMNEIEKESGSEYLLANYGRPSSYKPYLGDDSNAAINETEASSTVQLPHMETYMTDDDEDEDDLPGMEEDDEALPSQKKRKRAINSLVPSPRKEGEAILPHTDLSDKSKRIEIVTTAALPWKTGTAVNPLLRAAYMLEGRKEAGGSVTLMLPWLERKADQERVYGKDNLFDTPEDQEQYIRTWLRDSANMLDASQDLRIRWYTAWQNPAENSIYSMGDITALIPADEVDICILEEPEHLNWYRAPGESWTKKFKHVVGILHTNYFQYALDQPAAIIRAPAMRLLCSWMCRAHCHRVVKLSGTIDKVAPEKELVENTHGVRGTFLDVGAEVKRRLNNQEVFDPVFGKAAEPTIYFIGKMLWSKGLGSLMELLKYAEESAGIKVQVDMYGGGPDMEAAKQKSESLDLNMTFHGPIDHAELDYSHKIFVNPSTSEVLCTTSAEALAMGKFVILPSHVSNDFFAQFPNCLSYATKEEFVGNLFYAMTHSPEPMSDEYLYALSWRAATRRLEDAGCIPVNEAAQLEQMDVSKDGGVEIALPPLIENEKRRKQISTTFRYTRHRYRQFRSRLSTEILQTTVLPRKLRERLAEDLEKQLDLDIDEILESPKLRLKLSPAELDKSLLDFYDNMSASATGDVLRLISGGGQIGLQNLYIRRQALKKRARSGRDDFPFDSFDLDDPSDADGDDVESDRTASQWIRWAIRRNLPQSSTSDFPRPKSKRDLRRKNESPRMSTSLHMYSPQRQLSAWSGLAPPTAFGRHKTFSILI